MKVLSLFDGISCARVALDVAKCPVERYYASEIDKYAIQISQKNWKDIIQLGDIKNLKISEPLRWYGVDLLIGGSPCQDLSIAKKDRKGLAGDRSGLFYEYVRILNEVKPRYFILENVNSMPKEAKETITKELFGIEPVMINAALVSAQNRKRLFWVGKRVGDTYVKVDVPLPEDRGILLKDILEEEVDEKFYINTDTNKLNTHQANRVYETDKKAVTLKALGGGGGAKTGLYAVQVKNKGKEIVKELNKAGAIRARDYKGFDNYGSNAVVDNLRIRKLTPIECERLQSLPDNYTEGVSNTQRYKALGNAFNVEVIAHILKYFK